MIARLSATVVGALLSMHAPANADGTARGAHEHRERPAPVAASPLPASAGRHLTLAPPGVFGKRVMFGETVAYVMPSGRRSVTCESSSRATRRDSRDRIALGPRKMIYASDAGGWNTPGQRTALLWARAQEQRAKPPHAPELNFIRPVVYSLSFMAIGFGGFVAGGILEDDPSLANFRKNFTSAPHFEDDSPLFNFVLHPLWGSETYLRAREAHFGVPGSITFSLGASVTWEYLFESWTQRPSTQDLLVTTGLGWMIGEGRYYLKSRLDTKYHWWVDPIYTTLQYFNIGVNRDPTGHTQTTLRLTWEF